MGRFAPSLTLVWTTVLVLFTGAIPAAEGQSDLVLAAKREGRVTVYGSVDPDSFEVVQRYLKASMALRSSIGGPRPTR